MVSFKVPVPIQVNTLETSAEPVPVRIQVYRYRSRLPAITRIAGAIACADGSPSAGAGTVEGTGATPITVTGDYLSAIAGLQILTCAGAGTAT